MLSQSFPAPSENSVPTRTAPEERKAAVHAPALEAKFLVDHFQIAPDRAAQLIAENGATRWPPSEIAAEVHRLLAAEDQLEGVPVPKSPVLDFAFDNGKERLKPVLRHTQNHRVGAG